jgi:hypothetical protein
VGSVNKTGEAIVSYKAKIIQYYSLKRFYFGQMLLYYTMKFITILIIFTGALSLSFAQKQLPATLRVYLDCNTNCDESYIKSGITFVDFVLDRVAADVHLLITSQKNGNGGNRFELIFFGQNKFKTRLDTILFNQPPNASDVETRINLTQRIRLGLIPFITNIPNSRLLEITKGILTEVNKDTLLNSAKTNLQPPTNDRWNYWVYKIAADGTFNIDQNYTNASINTSLSANRTTNKLKINFSASNSNSNSSYKYENNGTDTTYKFNNQYYQLGHTLIVSVGQHWSVGYELGYSNSTFSNNKNRTYFGTGIEYAMFPYAQVNTKFFTLNYSVDVRQNNYYDTTIFDKTSEVLWGHKAVAQFSLKQKWGSMNAGITYSNYFMDWTLNNVSVNLSINLRISGGLFFYVYSYGELIHDQVYLVKGNATLQEILTRRRQLASGYSFNSGAGLSFRFGSILNNFVNPRFGN